MTSRWESTAGRLGLVAVITALAMTVALVLSGHNLQSVAGPAGLVDKVAFLPLALRDGQPVAASTAQPLTATVTPSPSSSPTPPVEATTTPPAEVADGSIVLQVVTWGGLSGDVGLSWQPTQAPWFTLYDNGTYIRARRSADGFLDHYDLVIGRLAVEQMASLVARFTEDADFFNLSDRPWALHCLTDQADTYVTLQSGGRSHRVAIYALDGYLHNQSPCRSAPGTPDPREDRFHALASAVDDLLLLRLGERPYEVPGATFIVGPSWSGSDRPLPPWTVGGLRLADVAGASGHGEVQLEGPMAGQVLAAIVAGRFRFQPVADFREDDRDYTVGLRVDVPATYPQPPDVTPTPATLTPTPALHFGDR